MKALVWIAGGALLLAMGIDTAAMLGRHLRAPLLGSIELVQATVLIAACGALLLASIAGTHARVHLLLDRLSPYLRTLLGSLHSLAAIALLIALMMGSLWIAMDLWRGHEESELLRIPYKPLRMVTLVTLLALIGVFLRALWRKGRP
jgi:TRAP-type transport system small permease protein